MDFFSKASILTLFLLVLPASIYGGTHVTYTYRNVTETCLRCICEVASDCNLNIGCQGPVCGPYRMIKPFWVGSGRPTVNNEPNTADGAFERCANNRACAELAIQMYMLRFRQDCTGGGVIDCDDFIRIHRYGGYNGCLQRLDTDSEYKYQKCMKKFG